MASVVLFTTGALWSAATAQVVLALLIVTKRKALAPHPCMKTIATTWALKRFPVFAAYVLFMTGVVLAALPVHYFASADEMRYFQVGRLINLVLLIPVVEIETFRRFYGPTESCPGWVWRWAAVLQALSFLGALVACGLVADLLDYHGYFLELAAHLLGVALWASVLSRTLYARRLSITWVGRRRELIWGSIVYLSAESASVVLPPPSHSSVALLLMAYIAALMVWIRGFYPREPEPVRTHPDVLTMVLEMHKANMEAFERLTEQQPPKGDDPGTGPGN